MKHITIHALITGFLLAAPDLLLAQTSEPMGVFLNVNVGAQTQQQTVTTSATFPLYGQNGSFAATQNVGRGAIFDVSVGYRATENLGAAVGFTGYSRTSDIAGAASVPHPLLPNSPAAVTFDASGKRSERSLYFAAMWFLPRILPVLENVDLAILFGPSFIRVEQDVLTNVSVPAGTQEATPVVEARDAWKAGVIIGIDASYMVTPNAGGGVFLRYQGAGSIDLEPAESERAGGFQLGGGVRLRF